METFLQNNRPLIKNVRARNQSQDISAPIFSAWQFRISVISTIWIAVVLSSCAILDVRVANWVHRTVPQPKLARLFELMKVPGHFGFTLVVAGALWIWHVRRWRAVVFLCLSAVISGILYTAAKWCVGRTRPFQGVPPFEFHPFNQGFYGLFVSEYHSFPSGHTCLAFATAAALTVLLPRWRVLLFLGAIATATERILQNSHYVSDVVAGAGFGVLSTILAWWLCELTVRHYAMMGIQATSSNAIPSDSDSATI
jgi:membrane-associated phospholipid phosphatase